MVMFCRDYRIKWIFLLFCTISTLTVAYYLFCVNGNNLNIYTTVVTDFVTDTATDEFPECTKPSLNMFLLKVSKCGSGTMMILLFRFVISHKLNVLIFRKDGIASKGLIAEKNIVPKRPDESYNVFANQINFQRNKNQIKSFLPRQTTYIGLVRNPLHRLVSGMAFFGIDRSLRRQLNMSDTSGYEEIIFKAMKFPTISKRFYENSHNYISHYYGLEMGAPNITHFIEDTFKTFDIILVVEYFDESLVLLKRYMCWDFKDIFYHKAHENTKKSFDGQDKVMRNKTIVDWFKQQSSVDYILYNKSVDRLFDRIAREGPGFHEEVAVFKKLLRQVNQCCDDIMVDKQNNAKCFLPKSNWNEEIGINQEYCSFMLTTTVGMTKHMIKYQYSK